MYNNNFQQRIEYQGELTLLLEKVCADYELGLYTSHTIIPVGYEDLNIILTTNIDKYVVKVFADFRNTENCKRYVDIMETAIRSGVLHPKLYSTKQGSLYETVIDTTPIRLCLLQYIEGESFYSLKQQPSLAELRILAQQAAIINQINIHPPPVYDSWAVVNFVSEFDKKRQYLNEQDLQMVAPLVEKFRKIELNTLPHCLVHGDIIKTNVMRSTDGKLYILDFSVANYYPRIQELAVLFCDLFFNEKNPKNFGECYELGLSEYQQSIQLTEEELKILPLYVQAAHAMHIVCPNYEREVNKNYTKENELWLELGRIGLKFSLQYFT